MDSRPGASVWGDDLSDEYVDDISDNRHLVKDTQKQILEEHEEGLNKLGEAIKRQKYMANELATEVEVHNEIIDNIDDGLTRTADNLRKNTRNIKLVTKKSSTFFLWFLIVILAAVIVGLAIF